MTRLTRQEALSLIHSYGLKCDSAQINRWLEDGVLKGTRKDGSFTIDEEAVYDFLEAYRWEGTPYEKGLDLVTRVKRQEEEIAALKKVISELQKEKEALEKQLGMMPF